MLRPSGSSPTTHPHPPGVAATLTSSMIEDFPLLLNLWEWNFLLAYSLFLVFRVIWLIKQVRERSHFCVLCKNLHKLGDVYSLNVASRHL